MAGTVGAPTPWWQLPGQQGAQNNLISSAPAGYQYDSVQMKYVPNVKSAPNAEMLQDTMLSKLNGATSGVSGTAAGGGGYAGGGAPVTMQSISGLGGAGGGGATPQVPQVAHVDTSAAESASFNKAKDQIGQMTSGAATGLRSQLGSRGMLGSGLESRGMTNIALGGEGQLGDTLRSQAVDRSNQAREEATTNYQGDITQRGQDIGSATSRYGTDAGLTAANYSGQVAQRGQDITAGTAAQALANQKQMSLATMLQSALSGLSGQLY